MNDLLRAGLGGPVRRRPWSHAVALVCLLFLLSPTASAAGVSARVDRSAISLDETVQLVLESDGEIGSRPDLSVLTQDFEIVDRRVSHSISVIGGQRSERHTLLLRLRPRRIGELRIPPVPFGDTATDSLPLSVAPPPRISEPTAQTPAPVDMHDLPSSPAVLLEADLEPPKVYIGQQLVLTAKVFMDGPIAGSRLHDPQIPNTRILPLGEDHYQAERDGQSYRVYERRYALFPRNPGRLEIGSLLYEGWVPATGETDSGLGYASPGQQVRARSEVLVGEVLPPPGGANKDSWLPARSLSLSESGPETYRVQAGQPIERRISLRADGIMARDLPALAVQAPHQLAAQHRKAGLWDERLPEGVIGNRQEVVVLSAREPGHYRLPPLSLEWWNTTTKRWETAVLPARDLVVSAMSTGDSGLPAQGPVARRQPWQQPALADQEETAAGGSVTGSENHQADPGAPSSVWTWIAVVFALAWIATVTAWWTFRRRTHKNKPGPDATEPLPTSEAMDPLKQAIDAVRTAYQAGNAGAAREALLAWAGKALPDQTPSNLARLAQRCSQPLRGQILLLEEAFFSPTPVAWDEQPVWEGLKGFVPVPPEEPASFRRGKPIRRRAANPDTDSAAL